MTSRGSPSYVQRTSTRAPRLLVVNIAVAIVIVVAAEAFMLARTTLRPRPLPLTPRSPLGSCQRTPTTTFRTVRRDVDMRGNARMYGTITSPSSWTASHSIWEHRQGKQDRAERAGVRDTRRSLLPVPRSSGRDGGRLFAAGDGGENDINSRESSDDSHDPASPRDEIADTTETSDDQRTSSSQETGASDRIRGDRKDFTSDDGREDALSSGAFSFADDEVEGIRLQLDAAAVTSRSRGQSTKRDASDEDETWWPTLFPPPEDADEGKLIKPLIELPLDGVLLQLFPVLLIGVFGLFLTFAVQIEAGRFDGMIGEDGGPVIVTDLRETKDIM